MKKDTPDFATKSKNAEQESTQENWLLDDDNKVFNELVPDDDLAASEKSDSNTDPASCDLSNIPLKLASPFSLKTSSETREEQPSSKASVLFSTHPSSPEWTLEKTLQIDDDDTMTARLIKLDTGERFMLHRLPFEIGRSPHCQLQIANMSLSRQHAKIDKSETGLTIQDLGSANGIQVNGIDVKQALLMDEDTITLGHVHLRFELIGNDLTQQKRGQDLMKRVRLTYPNWKFIAAAGLIGSLLLGSLLYKSSIGIDDRVAIAELSTTTSQPTTPIVSTQMKVNRPPESTTLAKKNGASKPAAQQVVTINSPDQNKPILNNLSAQTPVQPGLSVAQPEASMNSMTDNSLAPRPNTIISSSAGSIADNNERRIVTAHSLIRNARQLYQEGQVNKAIALLGGLSMSSKISIESQNQAASLEAEMAALEDNYQKGKQTYSKGDKERAWTIWKQFLKAEKKLQLPTKSNYALAIQQHVMEESLARSHALEKTDSQAAYRHLQRAAVLDSESQAAKTTAALEAKARDAYSEGSQLEQSNLTKAIQRWRQVTKLATPGNQYYIKAKAKLRFYEELSQ